MDATPQLRGIVAKRLSHLTDVTTHLDTESESIEEYCQRKNILVVAETEDLDVSGGKPIKERPGSGRGSRPITSMSGTSSSSTNSTGVSGTT